MLGAFCLDKTDPVPKHFSKPVRNSFLLCPSPKARQSSSMDVISSAPLTGSLEKSIGPAAYRRIALLSPHGSVNSIHLVFQQAFR